MVPDLLVCPVCRHVSDGRFDLRTLHRDGDGLACDCGQRYPIVDGVAMFQEVALDRDFVAGERFEAEGPDEAARTLEHGSTAAPSMPPTQAAKVSAAFRAKPSE